MFFSMQNQSQDFRFSSFPRQRESSNVLKRMDTRIRGYDGKGRQAKVLKVHLSSIS